MTFCSTACTCQSVGLVGAADVCPFERFLLATVLVVAEAAAVAGVAKVDLSTPPCFRNLVFQRLRYHARGVTQQRDVLGSLF